MCCDIGHIQPCASPVAQGAQAIIPTGAECHPYAGALLAGTRPRLGEGRTGWESLGCKVSRACSHALWSRVILHLSGPAVGAGPEEMKQERGRFGGRELGEAQSNQGEEKQAHGVIVTEPLNTTYKQARRARGGLGGVRGGHRGKRRSGRCGPGPVREGAQASVTGGAGLAEAWLLVEASQLHQQLLDEVLRTGWRILKTGKGRSSLPSPPQPL